MRAKTCRVCGSKFQPERSFQKWCNPECAIVLARLLQDKKKKAVERAEKKEAREKLKTRSDYLKEAQFWFNKFIRLRDKDDPCISCGRHHQGQYHCGHYRSVGSHPELRFSELNCFKQCSVCNNHRSGNLIEYRKALVEIFGESLVEWLEGPHDPVKYTIDDLKTLIAEYKAKCKELERG